MKNEIYFEIDKFVIVVFLENEFFNCVAIGVCLYCLVFAYRHCSYLI
jgi:hypothetical protein